MVRLDPNTSGDQGLDPEEHGEVLTEVVSDFFAWLKMWRETCVAMSKKDFDPHTIMSWHCRATEASEHRDRLREGLKEAGFDPDRFDNPGNGG